MFSGLFLKWWDFAEAKGSSSFLKEKVYYPYQGKEYPQRKWFYCASEKFQKRDIIRACKGQI